VDQDSRRAAAAAQQRPKRPARGRLAVAAEPAIRKGQIIKKSISFSRFRGNHADLTAMRRRVTVPTLLPRSATAATTRARPRNLQMAAGLLAGPRLAVAALLLSAASAASVTVHGCVCQNAADCDSNRPYRRGLRWCETTEPCVQQDNEQYDWDFCEAHTDAQAGREMCDVFGERGFDTRCPENKPPAPPGFVASVVTTFAWVRQPWPRPVASLRWKPLHQPRRSLAKKTVAAWYWPLPLILRVCDVDVLPGAGTV
jgi:hypothetical protein